MRKFLLFAVALMLGFSSLASEAFQVKYSQTTNSDRQLVFTLGDFHIDEVSINGQTFSTIVFGHNVTTSKKGWAQLPYLNSSVQISNDKNVSVDVIGSQYVDIQLQYPLLPSRGVIYRNQDPTTIPYEIDPASVVDAWYPKSIATAEEPFILRDVRGTNVKVYPFQYNAAQNIVRVYTQVDVSVNDNQTAVINPKTRTSDVVLREMDAMYKSIFVNYAEYTKEALTVGNYGDILVICTERDEEAMQPFIDWKKEKGFNVFKEVVEVGTNVKTLVQSSYDANPNILYVQLAGDWADVKCDLGGGDNAPMDPMLGCVEGTDWFPEIAVGRFSGTSSAHITIQVDKTINYEKLPEIGEEWYSQALGIASDDSQGSYNGDDGEMDYDHIQIIYDNKLDPFTYNQYFSAYAPGATSAMVSNALEDGVSIINYCGHGSMTSWGTTGFGNSNIATLSNENRLPFIFSVACDNGMFHMGECFAEAWLKKDGGGAVMTLMSTISQPWAPPMRGQDYFNDILTGGYDYDNNVGNGINTEEGRTFIGSIVVNGLILMYTEASEDEDLRTIQTWTTFGDCSIQPRTIAPAEMSLDNEVIMSGVDYAAVVTSDGNPVAGAMVGVSQTDGELFYNTVTDENGAFTIAHELVPGEAKIVVTAMNKETIYSVITVISPEGPYMVIGGFEMNTDNGMVVYNSEATMDLTFENMGADAANNVTVTITSTEDPYCTLMSAATVEVGTINPDEIVTIEDAFSFSFANDAPDQYTVNLTFDISGDAKEIWQDNVSFKINAPVMEAVFAEIDDTEGGNGNGSLDAGEIATLKINGWNIGHAMSPEAVMSMASSSPYISLVNSSVELGALEAQTSIMAEFVVEVSADAPVGDLANFSVDMVAGNYNYNTTFMFNLGLVVEDWETGGFEQFEWTFGGNANWGITDGANVYEGVYSAKSGDINDNQTSTLQLLVNATTESPVSFYYKVSSEGGYDYLKFYIDGTLMGQWAGEVAWTLAEYTCPAGEHTIKWVFYKDSSQSTGSDCAWVDYIILPGSASASPLFADFAADQTDICDGEMVNFTSNSVGAVTTYNWSFEGGEPATSDEQNPVVVYSTAGIYSVSLTVGDGTNENTMTKAGYIVVHNCTGVNDAQAFMAEVYPNPNNGLFAVTVNKKAKVEIISAVGHLVYSSEIIGKETIDLSQQAEGVYFVKIESAEASKVLKIVVRR